MNRWLIRGSLIFLGLLFLLALFPSLITPHSFETQNASALLQTPSAQYWLGTDELGRDLLARLLFGARISLSCALLATLISAVVGIGYGSLSGYLGAGTDQIMMRGLDVLYAVPDLLFYILLGLFLGRDFWGILIALSLLGWVTTARITRGEVLKFKQLAFIEAASALGVSRWRILWCHLLPQIKAPILVTLLLRVPVVILSESTLSFIGLGLTPPYSSWGTLASEGYAAMRFYPHLILYPALVIFVTIFSFQTIGHYLSERHR